MNIAILYGSTREARQGIKAARFLRKKLDERGHNTSLLDPMELNLPFLDKMYKEFEEGSAPSIMESIAHTLREADGFLIVSGEYNHSIPPALKNMLDHFQKEYHWKPSALATYSAGPFGGVRAGVHLRAVTGELGMPSIPSMFPISKVQNAFDKEGNAIEDAYERRVKRFFDEFEWYMSALKAQREKGTPY